MRTIALLLVAAAIVHGICIFALVRSLSIQWKAFECADVLRSSSQVQTLAGEIISISYSYCSCLRVRYVWVYLRKQRLILVQATNMFHRTPTGRPCITCAHI